MDMKKVEINNRLYSVMSMDEYINNRDLYDAKNVAILCNGDRTVLPIKMLNNNDSGPGIYLNPDFNEKKYMTAQVVKPAEDSVIYNADKIIDFGKSTDIGDVIEKNEALKDIQKDLMVTGKDGNIFYLNITPKDTPEMKALKTAINNKQVDKRAYEQRFTQFQNDMRLLRGHSITLSKMIGICNGFDISCTLTLKDKKDAVNPMQDEITVELTENRPSKKLKDVEEEYDEN